MSTGFAPARVRPSRGAAAPSRERATETFTAPAGREGSRLTRLRRRVSWPLGIYTTPVAILVLWQVTSELGWLPEKIAPAPTAIVQAGVDLWKLGELSVDLTTSLRRVGIGLAIGLTIGITTGIIAGLLRSGEYLFNGVVQIVHTIPLLAILPLMIVWFGIDELTKVLLISFGAGLPMYLNLFAAIRGVDQRLIEMARAAGVRRWRLITRVLLPGALPGFLVGLRFSLAYSVLGLVAAETINANAGIGYLINRAQTYLRIDQVYLGLVIYAILGLLADQFVRILERVLLQWRPSYEAS
ncbi:ABC transporter permease [Aeromicrobium sp. 9AM]|uniref:ABC transporter permease n=1 Tax=Aeromicrobium sp. 9AM TaxID=2653126 RepID=UPI0012F08360|nr:ABC transporter permease [Aeromicrobium sp. 9AM]VXB60173.1 aliphatic sulfonate ABC transporter (permease) [Aeromicrobium sp. 9AM]